MGLGPLNTTAKVFHYCSAVWLCTEVELTISAKCPYLLALNVFVTVGIVTVQITSFVYSFSVCWQCRCTILLLLFISDLLPDIFCAAIPIRKNKHFNLVYLYLLQYVSIMGNLRCYGFCIDVVASILQSFVKTFREIVKFWGFSCDVGCFAISPYCK